MQQYLVPDSSVIVKWLNQTDETNLKQADRIIEQTLTNEIILIAPELAKYEVGNSFLYSKGLNLIQAKTSLSSLYDLPIKFVPQTESLSVNTYKIAQEYKITFYDASFIALAKQENAILVTDNAKHQGKVKEVKVVALKDY